MKENYCLNCGEKISNSKKYCSSKCQHEYYYKQYISDWKNGIVDGGKGNWGNLSNHVRKYIFEKYNNKCSICGWSEINPYTNSIPLEIDHIDGNSMNHKEDNLRLICPNCHALTETYRGKNKGDGRGITWTPSEKLKREDVRVLQEINIKKYCKMCNKEIHITKHKNRNKKFCCDKCRCEFQKIEANKYKPTKEELEILIKENSFVAVGKMFNVSDNTIKEWCKIFGLPHLRKDLK